MYFNTSNKLTNPYLTSKNWLRGGGNFYCILDILDDTYCLKRTSMYPEYVNSVTVTGWLMDSPLVLSRPKCWPTYQSTFMSAVLYEVCSFVVVVDGHISRMESIWCSITWYP